MCAYALWGLGNHTAHKFAQTRRSLAISNTTGWRFPNTELDTFSGSHNNYELCLEPFLILFRSSLLVFTLKMYDKFRNVLWKISSSMSAFEFTSGVVFVVILSCVLSVVTNYFNISEHALSLESSVVLNGHGKILLQIMSWRYCVQVANVMPFPLSADN